MKKYITFIVVATTLLIIYLILGNIFHLYVPCIFNLITGLHCPGCGVTRMLKEIIHLNFYQAFRYNMLAFIFTPIFFFLFINHIYCKIKNKKSIYQKIPNYLSVIVIVLFLIFGIIRNIFPYFAPTEVL